VHYLLSLGTGNLKMATYQPINRWPIFWSITTGEND